MRKKICWIGAAMAVLLFICSATIYAQEQKMSVYNVVRARANGQNASVLASKLGINPGIVKESVEARKGMVFFLDRGRFQYVPTKKLGSGQPEEDKMATVREALNLDGLRQLKAPDDQAMRARFEAALKESRLFPDGVEPRFGHTTLQVFDAKGKSIAQARLDTTVSYRLRLNGISVVGPGANIRATFDGQGNVTQLIYAGREMRKGESVPIFSKAQVEKRFIESLRQGPSGKQLSNIRLDTKLVYYAPPMEVNTAGAIIPFYDIGGTAMIGESEIVLMRQMIPAVNSAKYVPAVKLEAGAKGSTVTARVSIEGGKQPYKIDWSSSSTYLNQTSQEISYQTKSRASVPTETISVTVTDGNGIIVVNSKTMSLLRVVKPMVRVKPATKVKPPGSTNYLFETGEAAVVGGVRDFGTENAVTNQFGDLEQGFIDEMLADGVVKRFSWTGMNAWEQDFKAPEDRKWIDNTDITFYVGHGNGDGFTFENTTHDDRKLDYDDATGDWGDVDLEWLALYSCQVLEDSYGGMNRFQRWKQEFDGLHLLLGFKTNARVNSNFSRQFASNMLDDNMTVRGAWFSAVDTHQPDDRIAVVMGVYKSGDFVWNYNDHFWGKGSVGPDIRGSNIGGYWAAIHQSQ